MAARQTIATTTVFDPRRAPASKKVERIEPDGSVKAVPTSDDVERKPYRFTDPLEQAVRVAITLGRPPLLQGDPVSGKTRLAHAVAYHVGLAPERAYVKSTTRAADLLTTFDAVARLYNAQLPEDMRSGISIAAEDYLRFGPFGRARHGRRSVLLIDEIDKADLDLPNDLLHELDQLEMLIPATGEVTEVPDDPTLRPVIVVTNNDEKQLDRLAGLELTRQPGHAELIDRVRFLQFTGRGAADAAVGHGIGALIKNSDDEGAALQLLNPAPA